MNSTNERLREIFTAAMPSVAVTTKAQSKESAADKTVRLERERRLKQDIAYRQQVERRIRVRVDEGVVNSLKNYQFYAASDLAHDATPVNKVTMPLILYAQNKINVQSAASSLAGSRQESFIKKDAQGKPVSIDLPNFLECNINLVRSFITRRLAAQSNIFSPLDPFYKYEARSTGQVARCRADVLSQRVEIMTDDYGYRAHDEQCYRDAMLYGFTVDLVESVWDVQKQWAVKDVAPGMESSEPPKDNSDLETEVVKEGIIWGNPHPSRFSWDNNYPLSSLNTDTGVEFLLYWDIKRFRDIMNNPLYFNTEAIGWSTRFWGMGGIYLNYKAYFDNFCSTITPPNFPQGTTLDPAGENDRKTNIGVYNVDMEDTSILITVYFEKVVPKDIGCGTYPFPVWVRFLVASDATVIYAEFLPSTPGAYLGINQNDSKQINMSIAHELMTYQDQMTNLFTEMLYIVQIEIFKAIGINTDCLEQTQIEYIRAQLKGTNWSSSPLIYEFSLKKMEELKLAPDKIVVVTETKAGQSLTSIFEAIAKLIQLAEKLMAMSPAEQGQPNPREVSATEVNQIANTTSAVYSFISTAINRFRAAKKRVIYESLITCGVGKLKVPVMDRYTPKTIKEAGFELDNQEVEGFSPLEGVNRHTVFGTNRQLVHDYIFTSRDGTERPVNTQAANSLVQLLGFAMQNPSVAQAMGKEKLYEIMNEIFRLSGSGVDLNLEVKPGEDNSLGQDPMKQAQQQLQQFAQQMQQLAQSVQQDAQFIQQQKSVNQRNDAIDKEVVKLASEVQKLVAATGAKMPQLDYKAAPPSVQAQIEQAHGFKPAPSVERAPVPTNGA